LEDITYINEYKKNYAYFEKLMKAHEDGLIIERRDDFNAVWCEEKNFLTEMNASIGVERCSFSMEECFRIKKEKIQRLFTKEDLPLHCWVKGVFTAISEDWYYVFNKSTTGFQIIISNTIVNINFNSEEINEWRYSSDTVTWKDFIVYEDESPEPIKNIKKLEKELGIEDVKEPILLPVDRKNGNCNLHGNCYACTDSTCERYNPIKKKEPGPTAVLVIEPVNCDLFDCAKCLGINCKDCDHYKPEPIEKDKCPKLKACEDCEDCDACKYRKDCYNYTSLKTKTCRFEDNCPKPKKACEDCECFECTSLCFGDCDDYISPKYRDKKGEDDCRFNGDCPKLTDCKACACFGCTYPCK